MLQSRSLKPKTDFILKSQKHICRPGFSNPSRASGGISSLIVLIPLRQKKPKPGDPNQSSGHQDIGNPLCMQVKLLKCMKFHFLSPFFIITTKIEFSKDLSNIKHQTSNIKYQISNIKHQISNIKHQAADSP